MYNIHTPDDEKAPGQSLLFIMLSDNEGLHDSIIRGGT